MRTIWLLLAVLGSAGTALAQLAEPHVDGAPPLRVALTASPRMFLNNAWAVGASYTTGLAGAEWLRVAGRHGGLGLGAGATGVGARALWYPGDRYEALFWRWYASGGVAFAPWRSGAAESGSSAAGAEVGLQHWYQETDWFLDAAFGVIAAGRGDWFGRRVLPVARLTVGRGFWL
jgi:hypothetical protein